MISKLANKDTLDFLGENAQYGLVKSLIEDRQMFISVSPYLNPNVFTIEPLKEIVSLTKDEYDTKGRVLGWKDIEYKLKEKLRTDEEMSSFKNAIGRLTKDIDGQPTATEVGINHLKTLELKRILKNCLETLKDGGYNIERAQRVVEQVEAIERATTNEDELSPEALFELVVSQKTNERVSTGIQELDDAMNGGLPKGNIALVIAGTGVGKTTFGSIMVMKSALAGNRVLHIFFEDTTAEIGRKYYSTLTGRYTKEYEDLSGERKDELTKEIMGVPQYREALGRIKPKRMRNGEDRVEDIINYVRKQIAMGWKPDMIVIDYMSCLKLTSDQRVAVSKEYELLEKAMKRLECFAQDENIAIWVEQQTNRDGVKSDTKNDRIGNVQGSFRLTQPASFIFYLERSNVDKVNRANLFMDKSRGCPMVEWTNFKLNNGNCQMDLLDMDDALASMDTDKGYNMVKGFIADEEL